MEHSYFECHPRTHSATTKRKKRTMNKITKGSIAIGVSLGLVVAGAPLIAQAHTPEVKATCNSITADLTNYEYKAGSPAEFKTVVVIPAIPAVEDVTVVEYEYSDGSWHEAGWKSPSDDISPTGAERVTVIEPGTAAVPEVTAQVETKAAVAAQDNSIQLILDGVDFGTARFGTEYHNTVAIDGAKAHTYKVVIDAIGTAYDKTISGKTTACPPGVVTIPTYVAGDPTCTAPGGYGIDTSRPAENPNGYEQDNGTRVYVDPALHGAGTYVYTTQKIGAGFDPRFPYGTKVVGETKQTVTVLPATGFQSTDSTAPCFVDVPENSTTYGEWTTTEYDCDTPVGTEVEISREVTNTVYVFDASTGEYTTASATSTETDSYTVTQADIDALDCPVPPVDEPEEPTTPVIPETPVTPEIGTPVAQVVPKELGHTGTDSLWLVGGGAGLLLGGALLAALATKRRERNEVTTSA